jgi:hypothetical protein
MRLNGWQRIGIVVARRKLSHSTIETVKRSGQGPSFARIGPCPTTTSMK